MEIGVWVEVGGKITTLIVSSGRKTKSRAIDKPFDMKWIVKLNRRHNDSHNSWCRKDVKAPVGSRKDFQGWIDCCGYKLLSDFKSAWPGKGNGSKHVSTAPLKSQLPLATNRKKEILEYLILVFDFFCVCVCVCALCVVVIDVSTWMATFVCLIWD